MAYYDHGSSTQRERNECSTHSSVTWCIDSITFKVVRRQVYDHSDLIGGYAKDTSATRRQIYAWNDLIG